MKTYLWAVTLEGNTGIQSNSLWIAQDLRSLESKMGDCLWSDVIRLERQGEVSGVSL